MDEADLVQLAHAYIRRKKWEARLLTGEIAQLFGGGSRSAAKAAEPETEAVSTDELLTMMNATVKGGQN